MALTNAQRIEFFRAMDRAWPVHRMRHNLSYATPADDREAKDQWYRDEMEKECGVRSIKDLNPVDGYETMRLCFAEIINDENTIAYFAAAAERRYKFLIEQRLQYIGQLTGEPCSWHYARGIYSHMQLPLDMEDCSVRELRLVFQALDTHARRLRQERETPCLISPGEDCPF